MRKMARGIALCMLLALLLTSVGFAEGGAALQDNGMNRTDLTMAMEQAKSAYEENTADVALTYAYANALYQLGDFHAAWGVLEPIATAENATAECIYLAGRLTYVTGRIAQAEDFFTKLLNDDAYALAAMAGLQLVYYQQNDFARLKDINFPDEIENPYAELAQAFPENPYQVKWHTDEKVAVLPFLAKDPLPVVSIEVNGTPIDVIFDTGADMLFVDKELAAELGIADATHLMGDFGGGKKAPISMGYVKEARLGNVTLEHVPATIMPMSKYSAIYADNDTTIHGAIGVGFIRQFVSTIDYENGRLILRERTEENRKAVRDELGSFDEMSFSMDQVHYMQALGQINGVEGLNFFVDSGLAVPGCGYTLPKQTLDLLGIAEPELIAPDENEVGGGGGTWPSGTFDVDTVGLSSLLKVGIRGEYGAFPQDMHHDFGYLMDGLMSHYYLREFASWTIDFDSMQYLMK